MEAQGKSFVYNISLCRICQDPDNIDLFNTSSSPSQKYKDNESDTDTYMDLLKSIFNDIIWIEDDLLSLACTICLKKVIEIVEFKKICLRTNLQRGADDTIFLSKEEGDDLSKEYDLNVSSPEVEHIDDGKSPLTFTEDSKESPPKVKAIKHSKKRRKKIKSNSTSKCSQCDICGEEFQNSRLLERHVFRHDGTRNYICPVCGRKYITNGDLITHNKSHSVALKFECDICQKRFKAIRNLSTHKAIVHMDPGDYKHLCTVCGNKFPTSERLKEHTKRHKQIKNYFCDLCDKAFVSKAEVQRHSTSHSNYQPFRCDLCSAEYKKKEFLLVHKSRQHGIGNYKRRLRQSEKPYQCRLCEAKFLCTSNIKPHLKRKHDIDVDLKIDFDPTDYYIALEIELQDDKE